MLRSWSPEPNDPRTATGGTYRCLVRSCALVMACAASFSSVAAQDVVRLAGPSGRGEQQIRGTVLEYTGTQLVIRRDTGQEERYEAQRVIDVATTRNGPHQQAEQMLSEGRAAASLPLLREALGAEKRPWVRRRILARTVVAYQQAGQVDVAGEAFALLLQSDPQSPEFNVIPLAWLATPAPASVESAASKWLASRVPAVQLLGASWLLSTPRRSEAVRVLEQLARSEEPRIALLSTAQLWRTQATTVRAEDLERWADLAERMPEPLRYGPYWLLGQAAARLGQHETAALYLLRIPILFPEQPALAAEALLAAGKQLESIQRADEAARLYRELTTEYPQSPLAAEAERRLQATSTIP